MARINAYITFKGNCREAMSFYKEALGGRLTLETVESSPMAGQWPDAVQKNILHASLVKKELMLLASDMGAPAAANGNTVSLSLTCSTNREIRRFFTRLSAGGQVTHPLREFFNGSIGAFTDKYGINWVLHYKNNN